VLKMGELWEKSSRCKSFRFRRSEGGLEVLIMQGLRERVLGSADSKGVAVAGGV
jgi:hypothetical protein